MSEKHPKAPTVPTEYPWYLHHPHKPLVLTQTLEEAQALVDADPLWRLFPYSDEEKAALATPDREETFITETSSTSTRRRS